MAAMTIPSSGITLHGICDQPEDVKSGSASAVLLKLSNGLLQDIKKAAKGDDGLQFVTGSAPKLRIGGRTIDLNLSPEAFRNELYASTVAGSVTDLKFSGLVSHRAELKLDERKSGEDVAGSDAALAALQSTLASYEQEKQAKSSNIVNSVLLNPKGRFDAAKKQKRSLLGLNPAVNPSLSASPTPRLGPAPTSAFTSDASVKLQAIKTPVIHLLALKPASSESIISKTHIPKEDLENILQKIAKQENGKWHLGDRAYRDLDVWKFGYTSKDDRQAAIDNAIRAYDRLRIGKEEKIWQQLLPKEDRGKGTILSRLHTGGQQVNRDLTPNYVASPLPPVDAAGEVMPVSAAGTPRVGGSTPRPASSKGGVMKRLLSKDPKKARAAEEAKEKKRKERDAAREAAASDRETAKPAKRQTTKKANPKVKSAEIVHSSDDESGEEGEVKDEITRVDSKTSPEKWKPAPKPITKKAASTSPESGSNAPTKAKTTSEKPAAKPKAAADPAKSIASLASKAATPTPGAGKATPRATNGLAAPSSNHKSQRSPQKPDSRPNVPSPLGAARPRVASDVSDRSAIGIQRARQGVGTPQGLGITNGVRKRQDTVTSRDSFTSSGSDKKRAEDMPAKAKAASNGVSTPKLPVTNGNAHKSENGVKRKAEGAPAPGPDAAPATKHRKTELTSSQSQKSHTSSAPVAQSTAHTSPDATLHSGSGSGSSDSAASVIDSITFTQGVNLAEKFRDVYYPAYAQMYDAQAAKQAKGEVVSKDERERLWAMHRRLEQMKREIQIASQREHRED